MHKLLKPISLIALFYANSVFAMSLTEAEQILILSQGDVRSIKKVATDIFYTSSIDQEVTDVLAEVLIQNYNKSEYSTTAAWIAEALGHTQNPRYRKTLTDVLNKAHGWNLTRHLKQALSHIPNAVAAPYEAGTIDFPTEERRALTLMDTINEDLRIERETREKQARLEREAREKEALAAEQRFQSMLKSPDPKSMYMIAGVYAFEGQNLRSNQMYLAIMERFPKSDWAVKAQDQMSENRRAETIARSNAEMIERVNAAEASMDYKRDIIESERRQIESERSRIENERYRIEDARDDIKDERRRIEKAERESKK